MFLTYLQEGYELSFYLFQFLSIFLIRIFEMLEGTTGIHIVSWVHTHLLAIERCHIGHLGIEMHVGHQGCLITAFPQLLMDMLHVVGFPGALSGESDKLTTCLDDTDGLFHTRLGIHRIRGRHRLDTDGVIATHGNIAHNGH